MREPFSAGKGRQKDSKYTSYRFIVVLKSLLKDYYACQEEDFLAASIRSRLAGYHFIYPQIEMDSFRGSLKRLKLELEQEKVSKMGVLFTETFSDRLTLVSSDQLITPSREVSINGYISPHLTKGLKDCTHSEQQFSAKPYSLKQFISLDFFKPWINMEICNNDGEHNAWGNKAGTYKLFLQHVCQCASQPRTVIFKPSLADEGFSKEASAGVEPITQTISLRSYKRGTSKIRDSLSVLIDLLMCNAYLDEFYQQSNRFDLQAIRSNQLLVGLNVAVSAYNLILLQSKHIQVNTFKDTLVIKVSSGRFQAATLLRYIVEQLIIPSMVSIDNIALKYPDLQSKSYSLKQCPELSKVRRCRILLRETIV